MNVNLIGFAAVALLTAHPLAATEMEPCEGIVAKDATDERILIAECYQAELGLEREKAKWLKLKQANLKISKVLSALDGRSAASIRATTAKKAEPIAKEPHWPLVQFTAETQGVWTANIEYVDGYQSRVSVGENLLRGGRIKSISSNMVLVQWSDGVKVIQVGQ